MKTPIQAFVAACVIAGMTMAVPAGAAEESPANAAIRANAAAFAKAYDAGDADAVLALFENDAIVMPPNAPMVIGAFGIRQFVERGITAARSYGIRLAIAPASEIGVSGDVGWHAGAYAVKDAGGATLDTGKYFELWHLSGGQWRIIRRIWNSNAPPRIAAPKSAATTGPAKVATPALAK